MTGKRGRDEFETDSQTAKRAFSGNEIPDISRRTAASKRNRDESEIDLPAAKHINMRADRRFVTAKRHHDGSDNGHPNAKQANRRIMPEKRYRGEQDDAELPTPKRVFTDSQESASQGAIAAPQPLRRSARLSERQYNRLLRYLPHGEKHDLEEPEPGPSEKRVRVLPAEQELMKMEAIELAEIMLCC